MIDARRRLPAPAPSAAPARGPAAAQPGGPGLHGRTRDAAGATQTRPARTQTHRPAARSAPPGPRRWRTRLEPAMRLRDSRAHPRFDRSGRVPHHLGLGPPALRYAASVAHRLLRNASRRLAPWRPPDAPLRPRQADIPPEARPQPENAQVRVCAAASSPKPARSASGRRSPHPVGTPRRAPCRHRRRAASIAALRPRQRGRRPQRYPQPPLIRQARWACHYTRQMQLSTAEGRAARRHFPWTAPRLLKNLTFERNG